MKKGKSSNLIDIWYSYVHSKKSLMKSTEKKTVQPLQLLQPLPIPNPKAWKLVPLARIRSKKWYDKGVTSRDNNVAHHNKPHVVIFQI